MTGTFRIDEWWVYPQLNSVARDGKSIRLEPRVMQVLAFLAERAGEVVSRETLIATIWEGAFVTDDVLTRCISALRKAFGDDTRQSRVIQTIAKRGYRLIAAVSAPAGRGAGSLAVLPFVSAGADPEIEEWAEVMVERVIDRLSRLPGLQVTARSAVAGYKGKEFDPREAGRDLGVRAVLTGSVGEWRGALIFRVELVETTLGWRLWGAQYLRKPDEAALSGLEEIAEQIAEAAHRVISLTSVYEGLRKGGAPPGLPEAKVDAPVRRADLAAAPQSGTRPEWA